MDNDLEFNHVVADFCIIPLGVEASVSPYIIECQKVLKKSGLNYLMHSYGTNVEGPWDKVMEVVKECHKAVHKMKCPRVSTTLKIGTRIDKQSSIASKIKSVNDKLDKI